MLSYKIIVDSAVDVPERLLKSLSIAVAPYTISFGDKNYKDFYELDSKKFLSLYKKTGSIPRTAQPSPQTFEDLYSGFLQKYDQILCVTVSSVSSGSFQSANMARENLKDEDSKKRVFLFDTLNCSMVAAHFAILADKLLKEGKTMEETLAFLETLKPYGGAYFAPGILDFLKKGGRVGAVKTFVGKLLGLTPICTVADGKGHMYGKARGAKQIRDSLIKIISEKANLAYDIYLGYFGTPEEAKTLKNDLSSLLPEASIHMDSVGCLSGTQLGPGALGAFFFQKEKQVLEG